MCPPILAKFGQAGVTRGTFWSLCYVTLPKIGCYYSATILYLLANYVKPFRFTFFPGKIIFPFWFHSVAQKKTTSISSWKKTVQPPSQQTCGGLEDRMLTKSSPKKTGKKTSSNKPHRGCQGRWVAWKQNGLEGNVCDVDRSRTDSSRTDRKLIL